MSRSYKKFPAIKDNSNSKDGKRIANKRIRKYENIPSGKSYKKYYPSWNISDFCFICNWREYLKDCSTIFPEKSVKELYKEWSKYYKRK